MSSSAMCELLEVGMFHRRRMTDEKSLGQERVRLRFDTIGIIVIFLLKVGTPLSMWLYSYIGMMYTNKIHTYNNVMLI